MRTLLYIFSVRNAIKRKKDLFSSKRSASCAMAKNNLLKRFATSAGAEVAQLALCASNCGMPTSFLTHIFNLSLRSGIFLNKFKLAKVVPIFKKGARHGVNNYRPISLLPVFSKILEKLVYRRLLSFLTRQNFFHENQFGF